MILVLTLSNNLIFLVGSLTLSDPLFEASAKDSLNSRGRIFDGISVLQIFFPVSVLMKSSRSALGIIDLVEYPFAIASRGP